MTAIVGLVDGSTVWMGGDSAGVGGLSLSLRSDPKVFINGEFLFGYTGSFRVGQLMEHVFSPPKPYEGEDGMAYMVKRFIPEMKSCLKSGGCLKSDSGVDSGGWFLAGYRGALYEVESDFQVAQLRTPYYACGCGNDLCLGAMHATEGTKMKPRDRIRKALEAAEAFSAGVRGPFTILSVTHKEP